uniref:Uncharacterized protein n=1 Tax=Arundo donax TaxID=35708 RepID=A0A0A9ER66_ARUDO
MESPMLNGPSCLYQTTLQPCSKKLEYYPQTDLIMRNPTKIKSCIISVSTC